VIHQLLALTRPLFVLDCETTGVDTARDRIVEIAFQRWEPVSEASAAAGHDGMTKEWRSLVDPGVPIPAAASRVHRITDERLKLCNRCASTPEMHPIGLGDTYCGEFHIVPTFKQLAANLAKGFSDCDYAGQNVRFDLRIVAAEMQRAGIEWSYAGARIVDSSQLERLAVPRSLSHLHEKYAGRPHDGAHGALSDVRAAVTVIAKQLEMHPNLPRDLDKLHDAQWPNFIDLEGKFRFVDGVACFGGWGKYAGRPMRSVDVGYWDFILGADFPPDVKALAREAKLGRFPGGEP
jgi:DNA polymerase-3 subunit epsilon